MTAAANHCEAELAALDLLSETGQLLGKAINSLGGIVPPSVEANYLFQTAVGVNRVADGFLVLRRSGRVDASKVMVRPAVELLICAAAALRNKEFLFRKAYSEWREDKKLLAKSAADEAEADTALLELEHEFAGKLPGYPLKRERLRISQAAEMAGLRWLYDSAFAIYCQFTHGSVRALMGELAATTDRHDTAIVCWCTLIMLDLLRVNTPAAIPDMTSFRKRLLDLASIRPEDLTAS
ncbi:MAG: DUF5677 domain-containing protein [Verrucomicrobiia bacterium]